MELRHLRYFVAVAEAKNFSRAARKLHVSQPPLSVQIGCLEDELGARLFDRTPKGAILTDVGRKFLPKARHLLEAAAEACDIARLAHPRAAELRIGVIEPAMTLAVANRIETFRTAFPTVRLRVRHDSVSVLHGLLKGGEIDVAVTRPFASFPDLVRFHLEWQEQCLAIPAGHPWSQFQEIPWDLLKGERILLINPEFNPLYGQHFLHMCGRYQVMPDIDYAGTDLPSLIWLVSMGYGVCPCSSALAERAPSGVIFRPFKPASPPVELVLAWNARFEFHTLRSFVGHFACGAEDPCGASANARFPEAASLEIHPSPA